MSLQIKARHCTIDDSLKSYIEKKLDRVRRYYSKIHSMEVIFTEERMLHTCDIEVVAPPIHVIATAEDKDIRASFDKAQKVVERNLKREKSRMIDSKRHTGEGLGKPAAPETPIDEYEMEEMEDDELEPEMEDEPR